MSNILYIPVRFLVFAPRPLVLKNRKAGGYNFAILRLEGQYQPTEDDIRSLVTKRKITLRGIVFKFHLRGFVKPTRLDLNNDRHKIWCFEGNLPTKGMTEKIRELQQNRWEIDNEMRLNQLLEGRF